MGQWELILQPFFVAGAPTQVAMNPRDTRTQKRTKRPTILGYSGSLCASLSLCLWGSYDPSDFADVSPQAWIRVGNKQLGISPLRVEFFRWRRGKHILSTHSLPHHF